jgi:hypothetical protein
MLSEFSRQLDRTVKENDSLLEQIDDLDGDLSKMAEGKKELDGFLIENHVVRIGRSKF